MMRTAALAALASTLMPAAAYAQDLVMRRPLPRDAKPGDATPTPDPGETPTPGATPTPEPTPNPTPTPTPTDPSSPSEIACGFGKANLVKAQWVSTTWGEQTQSTDSCYRQKMRYACSAEYSCKDADGKVVDTIRVWDPDKTCENYEGEMEPVEAPLDERSYPAFGNAAQQVAWIWSRAVKLSTQPYAEWQHPLGYDVFSVSSAMDPSQIYFSRQWEGTSDPNSYPHLRIGLAGYVPNSEICQEIRKQTGRSCSVYGSDGMWVSIRK